MKAILHCDREWGIGRKNGLMFDIPLDMKFFRDTTNGHTVVMGSNTLKSFPGGKPLKNRTNIVLYPGGEKRDDCIICETIEEFYGKIKEHSDDEVFVIGGAMMYRTMLPYCDEILVTKVDCVGGADAFFENLDERPDFVLKSESEWQETNGIMIKFCTYMNKNTKQLP